METLRREISTIEHEISELRADIAALRADMKGLAKDAVNEILTSIYAEVGQTVVKRMAHAIAYAFIGVGIWLLGGKAMKLWE